MKGTEVYEAIEKSPKFPEIPKDLSDIINMLQEPEGVNIDKLHYSNSLKMQ